MAAFGRLAAGCSAGVTELGKRRLQLPFAAKVVIGFVLGVMLGYTAGQGRSVAGFTTDDLGSLGLLVVRLLKALAVFLVLFASLDALITTAVPARSGVKLLLIASMNASVAMVIGITLMNVFKPGRQWEGRISDMIRSLNVHTTTASPSAAKADLSVLHNIQGFVPESLVDPLSQNNVVSVVILSVMLGVAYRRRKSHAESVLEEAGLDAEAPNAQAVEEARRSLGQLEQLGKVVSALNQLMTGALELIVALVPFAVFAVVAMAVGRSGLGMFVTLAHYLWVVVLGMCLQAFVYYPAVAWLIARRSPAELFRCCKDSVTTALSTSSSLATLPVTLRCINKLGVSDGNARLAACIGSNLNHDGIMLYEAMAALFLAQACGMELSIGKQIVVVFASILAGVGIAGVPDAGLVVLPLVLSAAGLPAEAVSAALPLLLPVDWIVGRCRAMVNVMSDTLVAILLDAWDRRLGRCGCGTSSKAAAADDEARAAEADPHREDSQEPESEAVDLPAPAGAWEVKTPVASAEGVAAV